jgi:hypothetical protein
VTASVVSPDLVFEPPGAVNLDRVTAPGSISALARPGRAPTRAKPISLFSTIDHRRVAMMRAVALLAASFRLGPGWFGPAYCAASGLSLAPDAPRWLVSTGAQSGCGRRGLQDRRHLSGATTGPAGTPLSEARPACP